MLNKFRSITGWKRITTRGNVSYDGLMDILADYATLAGDNTFSGDNSFSQALSVGNPVGVTDAINLQYYTATLLPAVETLIDDISFGRYIYLAASSRINSVNLSNSDPYSFISATTSLTQLTSTTDLDNLTEVVILVNNFASINFTHFTGLLYLTMTGGFPTSTTFTAANFVMPVSSDLVLFDMSYVTITGAAFVLDFDNYPDLFNIQLAGNLVHDSFASLTVPSGGSLAFLVMSNYDVPNIYGFEGGTSQPNLNTIHITENAALTSINLEGTVVNTAKLRINSCAALTTVSLAGGYDDLLYYEFYGCALSIVTVDAILVAIDAAGRDNGTLELSGGANGIPTGGAANANVISLQGRGWTVTHEV